MSQIDLQIVEGIPTKFKNSANSFNGNFPICFPVKNVYPPANIASLELANFSERKNIPTYMMLKYKSPSLSWTHYITTLVMVLFSSDLNLGINYEFQLEV